MAMLMEVVSLSKGRQEEIVEVIRLKKKRKLVSYSMIHSYIHRIFLYLRLREFNFDMITICISTFICLSFKY